MLLAAFFNCASCISSCLLHRYSAVTLTRTTLSGGSQRSSQQPAQWHHSCEPRQPERVDIPVRKQQQRALCGSSAACDRGFTDGSLCTRLAGCSDLDQNRQLSGTIPSSLDILTGLRVLCVHDIACDALFPKTTTTDELNLRALKGFE